MNLGLEGMLTSLSTPLLFLVIAFSLFLLSQGADLLIEQAVKLSIRWGIPKVIIGATIISLGTTLPEASVSVLAAVQGQSGLALGNGIGSIIANTGLILGLAVLIGMVPVDRDLVRRQGWMMIASSVLVIFSSIPFFSRASGGNISRLLGLIFVCLLAAYLYLSVYWSRQGAINPAVSLSDNPLPQSEKIRLGRTAIKFLLGLILILGSSRLLIDSVDITAVRLGIPQSIIAATLVAFGTSVPELIMAVKSVRQGHGELALGNIVGANVLNSLFVIGVAASVTAKGLPVPPEYFLLQYPAMLLLLAFFWLSTRKATRIRKPFGVLLLLTYLIYFLVSYL